MATTLKISLCTKVPKPPDCPSVVIDKVATTEPGGDGFFPSDLRAWMKKVRALSGDDSVSLRTLNLAIIADKITDRDLRVLAAGLKTFSERLDEAIGSGRVGDPSGVRLPAVVRVADGVYVVTGSVTDAELRAAPAASDREIAIARYHVERLISLTGSLAQTAARASSVRARFSSFSS